MIAFVVALLSLCAGPDVFVSIAPDQPAPHIYIGDPLILEFRASTDCKVEVEIDITPEFAGEPLHVALGEVHLKAEGVQWRTVDNVSQTRGRYKIVTHIKTQDHTRDIEGVFCRIDRPGNEHAQLPLSAAVENLLPRQQLTLQIAGLRSVRIDARDASAHERIQAALDAGFQVSVRLSQADAALCEGLAQDWHDRVHWWQLDPGGEPESLAAMAKALQTGGTRSPMAVVVADAAALKAMLDAGLGKVIEGVVVSGATVESLSSVRSTAEQAGYERLELHASLDAAADQSGALIARQGLDLLAAGASTIILDAALVFGDSLGPGFVYLDSMAHRLGSARYVGELSAAEGVTGHVFRSGDTWTVAVWSAAGDADAVVPAEAARDLKLYDGRNNPLPCPPPTDSVVTLRVGPEPMFVVGKGGPLLQSAALTKAQREALAICDSADVQKFVPKEAVEVIRRFSKDDPYKRLDFLNLLQAFPYLESQWHSGSVPRSTAVPALAHMSRLARALAVVEHEKGEPFVEPLQSMLSACGQFQSLYLTGSAGTGDANERPDWLLDEVSRLMNEAEQLAAEGRTVEAAAVAAIAQARAQALEIAAKAQPLSMPENKPQEDKEEPKPAEPEPEKRTSTRKRK